VTELDAGRWRLTFQRRVFCGGEWSNRGALPFCVLPDLGTGSRVVVPLVPGEHVWLAWMVQTGLRFSGQTAEGAPIRFARISEPFNGTSLYSANSIETGSRLVPIGAESVRTWNGAPEPAPPSLSVEIAADGDAREIVLVTFATETGWVELTGEKFPSGTSPVDAFRPHLLP
jgi:hypothetical protein